SFRVSFWHPRWDVLCPAVGPVGGVDFLRCPRDFPWREFRFSGRSLREQTTAPDHQRN
ncbi:hypothetical protein HGM15179_019779, partial [Zosterops borbonicus]